MNSFDKWVIAIGGNMLCAVGVFGTFLTPTFALFTIPSLGIGMYLTGIGWYMIMFPEKL